MLKYSYSDQSFAMSLLCPPDMASSSHPNDYFLFAIHRSATEESPLHHQSPSDGVFSTKKSKKSEPVSQASGEGSSPPGTDAGGGTGAKRRANSLKALLRNPFNRSSRSSDSESSQSRLSGQSLPSPPTSPGDFFLRDQCVIVISS